MKLSNPHTHTTFCDGRNSPWEMADTAQALGFVSLGFSEHSPQGIAGGFGVRGEQDYINTVRSLTSRFSDIRLWLATEVDVYGHCDRAQYDYIIGSVHYLVKGEACYSVDHNLEEIQTAIDELFGGDALAAAKHYYRKEAEVAAWHRPEIIAHYDLFTKTNGGGKLIDESDPRYRAAALEGLDAVKEIGALLEVNTGGMARGYLTRPYPARFILERWLEMGGRVILGSDCHDVRYLTYGFNQAKELLREVGFKSVVRLGGMGESMFVEDGLDD